MTKSVGKLTLAKSNVKSRSHANLAAEQSTSVVIKTLRRSKELETQAKKAEGTSLGRAMKMMENQESRVKLMKSKFGKTQA